MIYVFLISLWNEHSCQSLENQNINDATLKNIDKQCRELL